MMYFSLKLPFGCRHCGGALFGYSVLSLYGRQAGLCVYKKYRVVEKWLP
jgi:hypothetical protein